MAELLIDCEEDRMLRAVLVGMLRENAGLSLAATCRSRSRTDGGGLSRVAALQEMARLPR
jgi:hypothetical protein